MNLNIINQNNKIKNNQYKIYVNALRNIKQMSKFDISGLYFHGSNNLFNEISLEKIALEKNKTVSNQQINAAFISPDWEFASLYAINRYLAFGGKPCLYIYNILNRELDLFNINSHFDIARILKQLPSRDEVIDFNSYILQSREVIPSDQQYMFFNDIEIYNLIVKAGFTGWVEYGRFDTQLNTEPVENLALLNIDMLVKPWIFEIDMTNYNNELTSQDFKYFQIDLNGNRLNDKSISIDAVINIIK